MTQFKKKLLFKFFLHGLVKRAILDNSLPTKNHQTPSKNKIEKKVIKKVDTPSKKKIGCPPKKFVGSPKNKEEENE